MLTELALIKKQYSSVALEHEKAKLLVKKSEGKNLERQAQLAQVGTPPLRRAGGAFCGRLKSTGDASLLPVFSSRDLA